MARKVQTRDESQGVQNDLSPVVSPRPAKEPKNTVPEPAQGGAIGIAKPDVMAKNDIHPSEHDDNNEQETEN